MRKKKVARCLASCQSDQKKKHRSKSFSRVEMTMTFSLDGQYNLSRTCTEVIYGRSLEGYANEVLYCTPYIKVHILPNVMCLYNPPKNTRWSCKYFSSGSTERGALPSPWLGHIHSTTISATWYLSRVLIILVILQYKNTWKIIKKGYV